MTSSTDYRNTTAQGFTLVEMMVVIAILGVLISIAAPNLLELLAVTRLETAADELVADVLFARSESASRGARVAICPQSTGSATTCGTSATEWANGRLVFVDLDGDGGADAGEPLLQRMRGGSLTNMTLALTNYTPSTLFVAFSPYGGLNPPGSRATFTLCSPDAPNGRQIAVAQSGRPNVTSVACP